MKLSAPHSPSTSPKSVSALVRHRIDRGGERLWRLDDFNDMPFNAVAQALSRLARAGFVERLSKGLYYHGRQTAFGKSRPNPATISKLASRRSSIFPAGLSAAGMLGFTTQNTARGELATSGLSLPRKLVGVDSVIHTRRPEAWKRLTAEDAALLDFLRRGGRSSELSPEETIRRTLVLLRKDGSLGRLLKVAETEPPRVRALLGALGEQLGNAAALRLRESLNPFSRFDFGFFGALPNSREWQAKEQRP